MNRLIAGARVVRQGARPPPTAVHRRGDLEAIQLQAGMHRGQDSREVDEDPEAPIIELPDFGAVAHRTTVVPAATEQITIRTG